MVPGSSPAAGLVARLLHLRNGRELARHDRQETLIYRCFRPNDPLSPANNRPPAFDTSIF